VKLPILLPTTKRQCSCLHFFVHRPLNEVLQTKTETSLAAWIVSNCDISSRSKFVEELKKYIPVDIYGKCSGRPLCKPPCQHRVISR